VLRQAVTRQKTTQVNRQNGTTLLIVIDPDQSYFRICSGGRKAWFSTWLIKKETNWNSPHSISVGAVDAAFSRHSVLP